MPSLFPPLLEQPEEPDSGGGGVPVPPIRWPKKPAAPSATPVTPPPPVRWPAAPKQPKEQVSILESTASAVLGSGPAHRATTMLANNFWANLAGSIPQAQSLWHNGFLKFADYKRWMRHLGAAPRSQEKHQYQFTIDGDRLGLGKPNYNIGDDLGNWDSILWDQAWTPDLSSTIGFFLRGLVTPEYFAWVMNRNGVNTPELQQLLMWDMFPPPSIDSQIEFVKNLGGDVNSIERLGLDGDEDDFKTMQPWFRSQGLGEGHIIDKDGQQHTYDSARLAWLNHWNLPGIDAALQMYWRLRGDPIQKQVEPNENVQPYTADDLKQCLRYSGLTPVSRDRAFAMRFRLPERRVLLQLAKSGNADHTDVVHAVASMGYGPPYISKIVKWIWDSRYKKLSLLETREFIERGIIGPDQATDAVAKLGYDPADADRILSIPRKTLSEGQVLQMVTRRIMDEAEAKRRLKWMGYNDDDSTILYNYAVNDRVYGEARQARSKIGEAYRLGVIDRGRATVLLDRQGATAHEIDLALSAIDLEVQMQHVKVAVQAIRKGYLTAHWTEGTARGQLQRLGIDPAVIDRYISEWNLTLTARYREFSAAQNVNAFKRGLISADTLATRLSALGYAADDIHLLSLSGLQDVAKSNAAAALKASRSVAAQQRAARQQLLAVLREKKQAERDLARHGSPAQIAKWFAQGLIPEKLAYARLRQLEWPDEDIARLLASAALPAKSKQPSAKPASGQKKTGEGSPPPVSSP